MFSKREFQSVGSKFLVIFSNHMSQNSKLKAYASKIKNEW